MTISEQVPVFSLAAKVPGPDGADTVPDDRTAIAMTTAHTLDDTARHLAHASGHLDAARKATGDLRDWHTGHVARHLDSAHTSAHDLAAHLRARYPAEGSELDALTGVVGLAKAVSEDAKTATTAHLVQTTCNHLAHTMRHVAAMADDPEPDVFAFNGEHARTHLDGAVEHVGKLTGHLEDNYPEEAKNLGGLRKVQDQIADPETISGQAAKRPAVSLFLGSQGDFRQHGLGGPGNDLARPEH